MREAMEASRMDAGHTLAAMAALKLDTSGNGAAHYDASSWGAINTASPPNRATPSSSMAGPSSTQTAPSSVTTGPPSSRATLSPSMADPSYTQTAPLSATAAPSALTARLASLAVGPPSLTARPAPSGPAPSFADDSPSSLSRFRQYPASSSTVGPDAGYTGKGKGKSNIYKMLN